MIKLLAGIVTFNSCKTIEKCLAAIRESAAGISCKIAVCDNASTDGTTELISRTFPDIELISNMKNTGYAAGVNRIARSCEWEYFLVLNPDLYTMKDSIPTALRFAESNQDAFLVGVKLEDENGNAVHSYGDIVIPSMFEYDFSGMRKILPFNGWSSTKKVTSQKEPFAAGFVTGAFMLIPQRAWNLVGPMDENFFLYFEDMDWAYRLWKTGKIAYVHPGVKACHESGASFGNNPEATEYKMKCYFESAFKYFTKHFGKGKSKATFAHVLTTTKLKLWILAHTGKGSSDAASRQRLIIKILNEISTGLG